MSDLASQRDSGGRPRMQGASGERANVAANSLNPKSVWRSHPVRLIVVCGILLVGAVVAATGSLLFDLRDRALADRKHELQNLASALAEQIDRNFQSIEVIQTAVIEEMQNLGIASAEDYKRQMSGIDTYQRLQDRISALPHINAIVLTDTEGKLINFSRSWPIPGINVPAQDPSGAFKSDPQLISFVGKPMRAPATGHWVVTIARKFTAPNGEFLGVVQGVMELQYFEELFKAVADAPNGSIALFRRDGTLLVRHPRQETVIGQSFAHSALFTNVLSKSDRGVARETGVIDGQERLVSGRSLAHYPVVVAITTTVAVALANWKRVTITTIGGALLIGLVIGGVVVLCVWLVGKKLQEQNARLDAALGNMSQGLCMFDSSARISVCNQRYIEMYNLSAEVVKPGCTLRELIHHHKEVGLLSGDPEQYCRNILANLAQEDSTSWQVAARDGRVINALNHPIPGGGWVSTHEDITERHKAEVELEDARNFLKTVIEHVPATILVKDARDFRYVLLNRAGQDFFGVPAGQVIGKTAHEIFPKAAADAIVTRDQALLEDGHQRFDADQPIHTTANNSMRHITTERLIVRGADGEPKYLLGVIVDITEQKRTEAQIIHLAHHDALTDLCNRVLFLEKTNDALARLRRTGGTFNVLLLDLDHFKSVNDSLGHPSGDALLKIVAARLKSVTREIDVIARLGGDEFAILQIVDGDQRENAVALASRILDIICEAYDLGGHKVNVGTSVGIAQAPQDGTDADQLLKNADLALYRAKSEGRNRYSFFGVEMEAEARSHHELENDLRDALSRDEFELHYQAVMSAAAREVVGVEALVRWRHPERGLVFPDSFITVAEEVGLIVPLGEWILRRACMDAANWPSHIKLAVNLSAAQFRNCNLVDIVALALSESDFPPDRLELEITESVLLQNNEMNLTVLHKLRSLGVSIVLDDFGTGYSSLSYIRMFPFDKIKIDRSFVSEISSRADCTAIVCVITALGRSLNILTTAEGVETEEQFSLLRAAGVDQIQGFLFSRPRPIVEFDLAHPDIKTTEGKAA